MRITKSNPRWEDSRHRDRIMKITKRQLKQIIKEEYSKLKKQGLISEASLNEAINYSWPWDELGPMFEEQGFKSDRKRAGKASNTATWYLPVVDKRGRMADSSGIGYKIHVDYNRGTFRFKWYQRVETNEYPYEKLLKPGGGKWRWEVEHVARDLKTAVDEIAYEISAHEAEGTNPMDMSWNKK